MSNPLGINAGSLGNGKTEQDVILNTAACQVIYLLACLNMYKNILFFIPVRCRDVQQPGNAELTATDLGKPSADAEHAICSLHAQYDAVTGSKPRVGLPGMKQKNVHTYINTCAYTHQIEDTHRHLAVVILQ